MSRIQHSSGLQNGKATSSNSVEIKIVRTVAETLRRAVSDNGHFASLNVDIINVLDVTVIHDWIESRETDNACSSHT